MISVRAVAAFNPKCKPLRLTGWMWAMLFIPALPLLVQAQAKTIIGFVTEINGEWYLEDDPAKRILLKDPVPAGAVIRLKSGFGRSSRITITLLDDARTKIERVCGRPTSCRDPLVLPSKIKRAASSRKTRPAEIERSFLSRFQSVLSSFFDNPTAFGSPISRGSLDLQESLIPIVDGEADIGPAFQRLRKDSYHLQLERLGKGGQPTGEASPPTIYRWDPARSPLPVKVSGPGLYRIVLLDGSARNEPTGDDVWVLALTPLRYKSHYEEFQEAARLALRWGNDFAPDSRSFLRAYLDHLAVRVNISRPSNLNR